MLVFGRVLVHHHRAVAATSRGAGREIRPDVRSVPLVAFSEPRHGAGGTKEFLTSLVRHRFAGTVNDIVVEFNARYQDIADRYVAGEPIPRDDSNRYGRTPGGDRSVDYRYTRMLMRFDPERDRRSAGGPRSHGDPPLTGASAGPADGDMNAGAMRILRRR
jgi:hypothetical protein